MMNRLLLTLLLLFGTCTVAVAYDLNDGIAAYQSNDYATAFAKFTKAAEAGNADAQGRLALRYALGRGVPQDFVQAHKWFTIAASTETDKEQRDKYVGNRDLVSGKMTPNQITEAQRLAREWKPKK